MEFEKKSIPDKGMGAGGDWQEELIDGRITGNEAGEVEKQDAALKKFTCPTEKL